MAHEQLLTDIRQCTLCEPALEHGVRPVLQFNPTAKILIAGQAPGRKVHDSGIPFDDASGKRLREWLGVDTTIFYDESKVAILPMGFCYPGTGKSGDLPPRKECADTWRSTLMQRFDNLELTLVIGQYAVAWHIPKAKGLLTDVVADWQHYLPSMMPLPHPSPRNNIWLKKNPWFARDALPALQARVRALLAND